MTAATDISVAHASDEAPDRQPNEASRIGRADKTAQLFTQLARTEAPEDAARIRHELVATNMRVARSIAARYARRGIDLADLEQVAYEALIKAVNRFDTSLHPNFLAYAVPTIVGEIKHYFRNHGWMVRPPRRISELQTRISRAHDELFQQLCRSPRPREIADALDCREEDVIEALAADGAFTPTSLDQPAGQATTMTVGDFIEADDVDVERAEARMMLGPAMRILGERDQLIIELRFFHGWSQQQIAEEIGVSQMQVSRLLSRILARLRGALSEQENGSAEVRSGP